MNRTDIRRALLIINPKARQDAGVQLDEGIAHLEQAGIEVERLLSKSPEDSRRAVVDRKDHLDLVIVGGGDGTISSMAGTLPSMWFVAGYITAGHGQRFGAFIRALQWP